MPDSRWFRGFSDCTSGIKRYFIKPKRHKTTPRSSTAEKNRASVIKKGDNEFHTNHIEGHDGKDVTIIITHKMGANSKNGGNSSTGQGVWFSGGGT